jgi:molecular chaperone GrpE
MVDNEELVFKEGNLKEETEKVEQNNTDSVEKDDEVARLKKEIETVKEKSTNNYERYLRTLAELDNTRKRALREREEYIKYASLPLIKKLLPVIDDLNRALNVSDDNQDYEVLKKGVEMIAKTLYQVIEDEGVKSIEALGKPFDPQYHQPLFVEKSDEYPENTVIEQMQTGYVLKDRVIRPSLVKVSSK